MKKIVLIADSHRKEYGINLPKGDILIHAGDFDIRDEYDLNYIINWMSELPYQHIIFIGGNHDLYLEQLYKAKIKPVIPKNIYYLCNQSIEIEGIKIWGSPFSPYFNGWAFMDFVEPLREIWETIPEDTDIVITHCPPFGINDQVDGISQGCPALRDRLKKIKPKYHIHGHIHEGHGVYCDENTVYINASLMDGYYDLVNKPVVIDYE